MESLAQPSLSNVAQMITPVMNPDESLFQEAQYIEPPKESKSVEKYKQLNMMEM